MVHGPDGPAGRVGSRFCRILAGRVKSGQHFGCFLVLTDYFLVPELVHSDLLIFYDI